MKKLLLLTLLAFSLMAGSAQAAPLFSTNSQDNCQFLAEMAAHFAAHRESRSLEEAEQTVFNATTKNEDITSDVLHVIEIVYKFPRLSATQEGNLIYEICREE